ncbi:MAG: hypothetical protein JSV22_07505 [Bacteroidales bacterium]|nr:MAG: hypothetical protein JSV22_07505 [Bacteroidales bacterium]
MKTTFALLLLINVVAVSYTQQTSTQVATEENLRRIGREDHGTVFTTNMDELYEGVKGTPYLFNEWKPGNIYLTDSTYIKNVNIKFNIYTDELSYLKSTSGDSLIINRWMIWKFEIIDDPEDDVILFKEMGFKSEKSDKKVFARVIYDGKSKLILKYSKTFIRAFYKGAYAAGNKYDEYTDDQQYYIKKDANKPEKIKLNKKSVIKVLSDKDDKIKSYINKRKLALDNEDGVAELLQYYDSIAD